jgi:hypothetical protein
MRAHATYTQHDLEALDRDRAAQDEAERTVTPRLSALYAALHEREGVLRFDLGRSKEADTLYVILHGLSLDLGFREITPETERALRARWLVAPSLVSSRLP